MVSEVGLPVLEDRCVACFGALIFIVLLVLADGLSAGGVGVARQGAAVVRGRGGRRGGFGEEGQTEGWGRRALSCGTAAGTLPRTDGLKHSTFALLQHVLLLKTTDTHRSRQMFTYTLQNQQNDHHFIQNKRDCTKGILLKVL